MKSPLFNIGFASVRAGFRGALVASGSLALSACGSWDQTIAIHESVCASQARIIVRDRNLWREFRASSEESFAQRRAQWGPGTERAVIEATDGFDIQFGEKHTFDRNYPTDKIERNDVVLVKGDRIVAQYVDFIIELEGLSGGTALSCTGLFPALYNKVKFPVSELAKSPVLVLK